jgi:hypothetical protein
MREKQRLVADFIKVKLQYIEGEKAPASVAAKNFLNTRGQ